MTPLERVTLENGFRDLKLPPIEKLILFTLSSRSPNTPGVFRAWSSYQRLATDCGIARRTAVLALKSLVERGLVSVEQRRDDAGDRAANLYTFKVVSPMHHVVHDDHQVVHDDHHHSDLPAPQVVIQVHQGGDLPAPEGDHRREPKKETSEGSFALTAQGGSKPTKRSGVSKKAKSEKAPDPRHREVFDAYVVAYTEARGEKPTFDGGAGGKAAKEIQRLIAKKGHDAAIALIRAVYAPGSLWRNTASIATIALDPDKYSGNTRKPANGRPVQPMDPNMSWAKAGEK